MNISALIKRGRTVAKARGHVLNRATRVGVDRASLGCASCGMGIHVDANPPPNGIDLGGEALALNCRPPPPVPPALRDAVGVRTWPRGVVIELLSSPEDRLHAQDLALDIVREFQVRGVGAWIDCVHDAGGLAVDRLRERGVAAEDLLISRPDSQEQAGAAVDTLINSGAVDVIVIDDPATATPLADPGANAREVSRRMRKLCVAAHRHQVLLVFTTRVTQRHPTERANPWAMALKFYASLRLEVHRRDGALLVKAIKNKLAPPFREARLEGGF